MKRQVQSQVFSKFILDPCIRIFSNYFVTKSFKKLLLDIIIL